MKFYTLCLVAFLLGACLTTFAGTQGYDNQVKTELYDHDDGLSVAMFSLDYISEETLEVIPEWTTKTIGKSNDGYKSSVFHPPTASQHYLFAAYSKRL